MLIYAYVNSALTTYIALTHASMQSSACYSLFASYCTHLNTFILNESVYRDRLSGNSRDGCSAIAWYLQPLPGTRPSYSVHRPIVKVC